MERAERFMTSWHKHGEEASRQQAIERDNKTRKSIVYLEAYKLRGRDRRNETTKRRRKNADKKWRTVVLHGT